MLELQAALGIPQRRSCRWPTSRCGPPSGPRTGGSTSRSTSSTGTRAPEVLEVRFDGIEDARPTTQVRAAIGAADVIVIGPSNPLVSLGPILAVPAMAELLGRARARGTPVVAVSGIIGGAALKGPADRMLASMGHESSARGVAAMLAPHIDAFVLDTVDADQAADIEALGLRTLVTDTIMRDARRSRPARARGARLRGAAAGRGDRVRETADADEPPSPTRARRAVRIAAIIPVANLEGAKTRLGETLDAEERHDLVHRPPGTDRGDRPGRRRASTTSWSSARTARC